MKRGRGDAEGEERERERGVAERCIEILTKV